LKLGIYVHSKRPKISVKEIIKVFQSVNIPYSEKDPDIAIVIGGDGTFGYYGRILRIPMLFVGINDPDILGSKAKLAGISYDYLARALISIKSGRCFVDKRRMFSLNYGTEKSVDILTDIYLERGNFSHGIRYALSVSSPVRSNPERVLKKFTEYAIGNGVIISTSFGSGGYYSYPQRILQGKFNVNDAATHKRFSDNRIGICHIIPTFLLREKNEGGGKKKNNIRMISEQIQYTVPIESTIKINLIRNANVRLYGTTDDSKGTAVGIDKEISIKASNRFAKIIQLYK
jgi:NAD+ kinase